MDIAWIISIYFVTWWICLFAVLPLGIQSHHEAGTTPGAGHDPGAPVNPNLKKKFITTSWVAAIVTFVIWATYTFHLIKL
jgi:predicted secreted protein